MLSHSPIQPPVAVVTQFPSQKPRVAVLLCSSTDLPLPGLPLRVDWTRPAVPPTACRTLLMLLTCGLAAGGLHSEGLSPACLGGVQQVQHVGADHTRPSKTRVGPGLSPPLGRKSPHKGGWSAAALGVPPQLTLVSSPAPRCCDCSCPMGPGAPCHIHSSLLLLHLGWALGGRGRRPPLALPWPLTRDRAFSPDIWGPTHPEARGEPASSCVQTASVSGFYPETLTGQVPTVTPPAVRGPPQADASGVRGRPPTPQTYGD